MKAQQEELFLIDIEREREKKDKTGKTMMIKQVRHQIFQLLIPSIERAEHNI